MGFFSLKSVCDCCGCEMGFSKYKYKDGYVCPTCQKKISKVLKTTTLKITIKEAREIINKLGDNWDKCDCCGGQLGKLKYKAIDGTVCGKCSSLAMKKYGKTTGKLTMDEILIAYSDEAVYQADLTLFNPTKKIGSFLEIDENRKEWLIPDGILGGKKHPRIFKFSDIVNYELLVDESSVASGGVGRAIAGGLLFGGAGAIVGGVTGKKRSKNVINSMKIKITVNDLQNPTVYIKLITSATKTDSMTYRATEKVAQECLSVLDLLVNNQANKEEPVKETTGDFMFCRECGNKIPRDSKFCAECGTKL